MTCPCQRFIQHLRGGPSRVDGGRRLIRKDNSRLLTLPHKPHHIVLRVQSVNEEMTDELIIMSISLRTASRLHARPRVSGPLIP